MMKNGELKSLANLAKQRLRNANYLNSRSSFKGSGNNNYFMKNVSSFKKLSGNCEFVRITDQEDLQFLKKVHSMLSSAEDIYNPIGRLIDKDHYKTLSEFEKQQYVLITADRYNKARENYLKKININNG